MLRYIFNFLIITIYIYISLFIVYEKYNQKIYVCNKYAKRMTLENRLILVHVLCNGEKSRLFCDFDYFVICRYHSISFPP